MSPDVQNRGISGPTRRTSALQILYKKENFDGDVDGQGEKDVTCQQAFNGGKY